MPWSTPDDICGGLLLTLVFRVDLTYTVCDSVGALSVGQVLTIDTGEEQEHITPTPQLELSRLIWVVLGPLLSSLFCMHKLLYYLVNFPLHFIDVLHHRAER